MNELEQRVARAIIDAEESAAGQGAKFIPKALTEDHSGDCTKDPWTCSRCYAEQYIEMAQAALKAHAEWLESQGLVVVRADFPKPSDNRGYQVAFIERHGRPTDGLELDGGLWRWLKTYHEAMISAAHQQEE